LYKRPWLIELTLDRTAKTEDLCIKAIKRRDMVLHLEAIGEVRSAYKDPKELIFACEDGLKTKTDSMIVLNPELEKGLYKLEEFSHLFVMYHLHRADRIELITHPGPPGETLPKVGVFASRSQYRPNHIALRLVKLKKIEKNILHIEGLDAVDGSKVLDIKPYVKGFDRPAVYTTAEWYGWLDR
jgi:tRNA (adenine37-N6)-methyltransferase